MGELAALEFGAEVVTQGLHDRPDGSLAVDGRGRFVADQGDDDERRATVFAGDGGHLWGDQVVGDLFLFAADRDLELGDLGGDLLGLREVVASQFRLRGRFQHDKQRQGGLIAELLRGVRHLGRLGVVG